MSAPTLPGDIPGLLRPCSPAFVDYTDEDPELGWVPAIVINVSEHGCPYVCELRGASHSTDWIPEAVALDLGSATGRSHADKWLAEMAGDPHALGARLVDCRLVVIGHLGRRRPGLLDDLDPNDPRLLDDGSRWVDAEALRRVVLKVAGR